MKKLFALLLGTGVVFAQTVETGKVISPAEANALVTENKAVIVDVREDGEWKQQHIPGAIHIPLGQLQNRLAELEPYKQTKVIAQCRSGHRSQQALKVLKAAGFENSSSLDGGILAWNKAGLKIE